MSSAECATAFIFWIDRALLVTRSGKGQPASDAQVAIASFGIDYTDTAVTVSSVDETVVLPSHSSPISHASYASSGAFLTTAWPDQCRPLTLFSPLTQIRS